jgi:hypothetical protein
MVVAGKSYSKDVFDDILRYDAINEKRKMVNEVILKENVIGRNFGKVSETVVDWLFENMKVNNVLPDDKLIEDYARLVCSTKKN